MTLCLFDSYVYICQTRILKFLVEKKKKQGQADENREPVEKNKHRVLGKIQVLLFTRFAIRGQEPLNNATEELQTFTQTTPPKSNEQSAKQVYASPKATQERKKKHKFQMSRS